ncbi:hypothetical protein LV84_03118 [Algoriphagus ratkowskyi]|uniref:Tryptophan-rich sensory protein n=1 Tax=Algoriphagus ratkowskyi TaxID=57028 RepID=A0A2W7QYM1_9BACT|nr:hypothetical protein [Algoriphagus ratkowskyi]PZX53394.1 hypothetical protein LV84_03118 [Algoriphagus ratkowskyi]TXD76560.1 hypothetical protein ESW18_16300 [Algoriphagus ratkowskyi]
MSIVEHYIAKIELQLRVQAGLKAVLSGLVIGVFSMVFFASNLLVGLLALVGFLIAGYFLGLFQSKRIQAIRVMHEQFPTLEFSLELLEKPTKNIAEQLQWERVNSSFQGGKIHLWYKKIGYYLIALLLAIGVYSLTFLSFKAEKSPTIQAEIGDKTEAFTVANSPVEMTSAQVTIIPPGYTGLPKLSQSNLDIKVLKGSRIEWVISLANAQDADLELININGEGLAFGRQEDRYVLRDQVINSGIYALQASKSGVVVYKTEYYPLEAIDDLAPVIVPTEKEVYKYHFAKDLKIINVTAKVTDDFVVKEVYLVATLARGSGENVRFRESRIAISNTNFKSADLSVKLDLNSFEFSPGDELYYYWAAMDNKSPDPNFSRSDTYFLNYVDSTGVTETDLIGMAIHVMPEYFRSQRQIIIDTEKLLASKKSKTEKEYNSTSNGIGADQKVLRMRYGQFLGEEYSEPQDGSEPVDFLNGHDHDHSSHAAGMHETPTGPELSGEEKAEVDSIRNSGDDGLGGLMNSFLNTTQNKAQAEVDEVSSIALLKMAIEEMWESELHLRLLEPEKALPFQYKALEYLKTVQQKSRAYVKRSGFDPPPLKQEEKRLTGELEDLKAQLDKEQMILEGQLAPLAAKILGLLPKQQLSASDKVAVQQFGELWTARMNYSGIQDWSVLLRLQELSAGKITEEGKKELYQKLNPLVIKNSGVNSSFLKQKELEKAFWSKLQ